MSVRPVAAAVLDFDDGSDVTDQDSDGLKEAFALGIDSPLGDTEFGGDEGLLEREGEGFKEGSSLSSSTDLEGDTLSSVDGTLDKECTVEGSPLGAPDCDGTVDIVGLNETVGTLEVDGVLDSEGAVDLEGEADLVGLKDTDGSLDVDGFKLGREEGLIDLGSEGLSEGSSDILGVTELCKVGIIEGRLEGFKLIVGA